MELRELRTLITLEEAGSLSKTAGRLHLSAPAVHKQLKTLESELEVCLYERKGRSLYLTQAAEMLLPFARSLVAQHDLAMSTIEEWRGLKRGLVRIGAGPNMSSYILPNILGQFRELFGSVDVSVETGSSATLTQELRDGGIDLALLVTAPASEDPLFRIEASWDVEYVLVTNMPCVPRKCSLRDLGKFPFVHYRRSSRTEALLDHYFAQFRFQPFVTMTFDNGEAIMAILRDGYGIAMLPYWIVDDDLRTRRLRLIRQREQPLISRMDLLTRAEGYTPPAVAAFAKLAREFHFIKPRLRSQQARRS
ncbi:MAG: LysR family transcriptional regulator [Acidobacteriaceae bacterium]|nr:LysR family transcriptional regulator [Acidobacteriaceae bacterium]